MSLRRRIEDNSGGGMQREYQRWFSSALGRDMEMLTFGHGGLPVLVFPTSCGRYYEFEDRHMVASIAQELDAGELQLFCVDSVDAESWYNRDVPPRWRIARQMQYQEYILREVLPYLRQLNANPNLVALGCSFGGYHAANLAFRYPDLFTGMFAMSGVFDVSNFLHGYYDEDCYFNLPAHYLPNMTDPWYLDRYRRNSYVLATAEHDQCWNANERMAAILRAKNVPVRLEVWDAPARHDWPWWERMLQTYL